MDMVLLYFATEATLEKLERVGVSFVATAMHVLGTYSVAWNHSITIKYRDIDHVVLSISSYYRLLNMFLLSKTRK